MQRSNGTAFRPTAIGVGKTKVPPMPTPQEAMAALGAGFAEGDVLRGLPDCTVDFKELERRADHG